MTKQDLQKQIDALQKQLDELKDEKREACHLNSCPFCPGGSIYEDEKNEAGIENERS